MYTSNNAFGSAVNNEINAINENMKASVKQIKGKRANWELIAALGTLVAIATVFVVLNHLGLIREF